MQFVKGEAAIRHKEYLIIADLHIGWSKVLYQRGYFVPDEVKEFEERIKKIKGKSTKLVILGDLKNSIGYEDVPKAMKFLRDMNELFDEVILVKGNHDGGINYPKVDEFDIDNIKLIHGHMWPKNLDKEILIMGHIHSAWRFESGRKIPCWAIGELKEVPKYNENKVKEVIIMPSFNRWITGTSKTQGPLLKYFKLKYVMDLNLRILSEE